MGCNMSNAYWNQFSPREIDSMHGVEQSSYQDDDYEEPEPEEGCYCSNCMDCLGMSWKEFM